MSQDGLMTATQTAVERHNASMHRLRRIYVIVIVAVVVITVVIAARVWATGEENNTTVHTASKPPAAITLQAPASSLTQAWHTTDKLADGVPVWKGTAITSTLHTVRGRDALTGKITWSYSRSNRKLCNAEQYNGVTVALYQVNGNCDEMTALDSQTGKRKWTRTLDMEGRPVNGHPTIMVNPYTVLVTTPQVIYAVDIGGGLDRWEWHQKGCTVHGAVVGSLGALISQTCTGQTCPNTKICGNGPQLILRDAYAGHDDKAKDSNQDQIKWNKLGDTDVPISADQVISALNTTTHALDVLNDGDGSNAATLTLSPAPTTTTGAVTAPTADTELIWLGGTVYAVSTRSALQWTASSLGPTTVASASSTSYPIETAGARVTLVDAGGAVTVDSATGKVTQRSTIAPPAAGGWAYPVGAGFVVAGPDGTIAYQ